LIEYGEVWLVRAQNPANFPTAEYAVAKVLALNYGTKRPVVDEDGEVHYGWDEERDAFLFGNGITSCKAPMAAEVLVHAALEGSEFLSKPVRNANGDLEIYFHNNFCIMLSEVWGIDIDDDIRRRVLTMELDWQPDDIINSNPSYRVRAFNLEDVFSSGTYDWETARKLIRDLLAALAVMHGLGLTHGDLNPGNILIQLNEQGVMHPRIIDWGFTLFRWHDENDWFRGSAGTADFNELGEHDRRQYDLHHVFALGWYLVTGNWPSGIEEWQLPTPESGGVDLDSYRFSMNRNDYPELPETPDEPSAQARREMSAVFDIALQPLVHKRPSAAEWLTWRWFNDSPDAVNRRGPTRARMTARDGIRDMNLAPAPAPAAPAVPAAPLRRSQRLRNRAAGATGV
jgi:hypothetical protein